MGGSDVGSGRCYLFVFDDVLFVCVNKVYVMGLFLGVECDFSFILG